MTTSVEDRIQAELWRGAIPVEIHLAADEVADVRAPPHFSGSSREARTYPCGTTGRRSRRRGGTSNRSSRGSRTTKAPRERERTRSATKTRRRARVRRTTRRNKNTRRALQAKRAMTETKTKTNANRRAGSTTTARRCAGTCAPGSCTTCSCVGIRTAPSRPPSLGDSPCTTPRTETTKTTARARRGRIPEPPDAGSFACVEAQSCARAHFFNALKEATHIERGSAASVMSMTRAAQTNLWRSVLTGDRRLAFEAEEALSVSRMFRETVRETAPTTSGV